MKTTLFTGVAQTWYEQRIQHMFGVFPDCQRLHKQNHLLGTCVKCKHGRFARSAKWRIRYISLTRMHVIFEKDLPHLRFTLKQWPNAFTCLEYPLPAVKYHTTLHIPKFYDLLSHTVIDFLTDSGSDSRLLRATDSVLKECGYRYIVFNGKNELYRRDNLPNESNKDALVRAFKLLIGD